MTLSLGRLLATKRAASVWDEVRSALKLTLLAGTAPRPRTTVSPSTASAAGYPRLRPERPRKGGSNRLERASVSQLEASIACPARRPSESARSGKRGTT